MSRRRQPANGVGLGLALWLLWGLVCGGLACGGATQKLPTQPATDCAGGKAWHQDDGGRYCGCRVVQGTLELGGALRTADDLAALEVIRGDLVIGPSYQLDNMSALAGLRRIEGNLYIRSNMMLGGVFLGALEWVGGDLRIEGNTSLRSVSLAHLHTIGGTLAIGEDNRSLDRVDLSGLVREGGRKLHIDWQKGQPDAVLRRPVY